MSFVHDLVNAEATFFESNRIAVSGCDLTLIIINVTSLAESEAPRATLQVGLVETATT